MRVTVFAGGDPVPGEVVRRLPPSDLVIAADSGAAVAQAGGIHIDHLVGDFDSLEHGARHRAIQAGATPHGYPVDKDATDLELALELAAGMNATSIVVVGGHGGRIDHLLANVALLADDRWPNPLTWWAGPDRVEIVRGFRAIDAGVGNVATILAMSPAQGVTAKGLRWELDGADLRPGSTRGVSNEVRRSPFTVEVEHGTLAVILPAETAHHDR